VPSRTRFDARLQARFADRLRVGEQLPVDGVGDPSLQAAHRFGAGLAGGQLAPVVGPAFGVEADLSRGGDVDHVVHPPVRGP
jgi:hypothetical protein